MPDWFAKTKEMMASDLYFSLVDAGTEAELISRYNRALDALEAAPKGRAPRTSAALQEVWGDPKKVQDSIGGHFEGDWIYYRYYNDPDLYKDVGGKYWPLIPSSTVLDVIRVGTKIAIHKALGETELAKVPQLTTKPYYREAIWKAERENDVVTDGVLPLATSWNCVAPAGSDFFEAAALRGPTVVELAIATPKPYGRSPLMDIVQKVLDGGYDAFKVDEEEEQQEEEGPSSSS
jgi:hypothetical protein